MAMVDCFCFGLLDLKCVKTRKIPTDFVFTRGIQKRKIRYVVPLITALEISVSYVWLFSASIVNTGCYFYP